MRWSGSGGGIGAGGFVGRARSTLRVEEENGYPQDTSDSPRLERHLAAAWKEDFKVRNRRRPGWWTTLALGLLGSILSGPARAEFALRDGDTVVFLGDSITAARTYGKIVENYTLLRFPDRKVRFINAGWGGDTAAGGLKRLERDVFDRGATVLIVAYGVNDIGWGLHADAEHKRIYLDAIRGIVAKCKARGVRVFIGSAAITAEDPERAEQGFLQMMCDEGMAIARERGEHSIDI